MTELKPFQYYSAYGYYVSRNLVPMPLIERVASTFYSEVKTTSEPVLRQSGKVEPSRFDSNGFIINPVVNPHLSSTKSIAGFKTAVAECLCSESIRAALQAVTLAPEHVLQQVMVFEQAATPPHQDWVYLDSFPPGHLTAAWVALEDIHPTASRFFVLPGSQDVDTSATEEEIWSGAYTSALADILKSDLAEQVKIPEMRAGDVLFWNSRLIHGSIAGQDPTRSRLSLTAHYIPHGFGFGKRNKPCAQAFPFQVDKTYPIAFQRPQ